MEQSKYLIHIYGKKGCEKCEALKKRIQTIISKETYQDFSYKYFDLTTEEGLFQYAKAETVNGQRIPSMQILSRKEESDEYSKIIDRRGEKRLDGKLFVPVYLQLETDYSDPKRSVIKPNQIKELLELAKNQA